MESKINEESLPVVTPDEFIPSISRLITSGGVVLIIIFSAASVISTILSYDVTIKASATIRPVGELRLVQATTEGVIKSIRIKENQIVKKGEVLAYIDDSQLQTKKAQLQGNIEERRLQLAQIEAQINSLNLQVLAENKLIDRSIASAEAEKRLQTQNYQDKKSLVRAEVEQAQVAFSLARDEMQRYQQLANSGAIALLQLKQKEQAFQSALIQLRQVKTSLNPSNAEVAIANEKIAQEKARGLATIATLKKEQENLRGRQIELQNQMESDVKSLQQTYIELSKTIIRSPSDGTVLTLELRNTGQMVQSGGIIAQITPSSAGFIVKAYVAGQDIDKVKPGQQVQMRVSACPYTEYGTLKGVVKAVAPDALPSNSIEKSAGNIANISGLPLSYKVIIQPQTQFVGIDNSRPDKLHRAICKLKAGMESRADIISRRETVMEFILRKFKILTEL
jgi:HlyD family type I secretion membrane fusion protein